MKPGRSTLITVLVIAVFVAFLIWSTIDAQAVECQVCVRYQGQENCATASGVSESEASRSAQTTACGPLVRGMNDAIACDNTPPTVRQCRRR